MLPQNVTDARNAATEYTKAAGTTAAAEPLISDVLRQKITEAYASSQDIVKPLDVATKNYLGAPAAAREKYQSIFNPFQRENLVTQYTGTEALPMLSLSSILGQRFGRVEDTIGAGTNAFKSQVLADQAKAQLANDLYSTLLNEYTTGEQLKSQSMSDRLAREKFEWDKTHGSGSGLGSDFLSNLKALGIGTGVAGTDTKAGDDEWEVQTTTPDWITELGGQDLSNWQDPLLKAQQDALLGNIIGGIDLSKLNIQGLGGNTSSGLTTPTRY
jgi:hypothetical protein